MPVKTTTKNSAASATAAGKARGSIKGAVKQPDNALQPIPAGGDGVVAGDAQSAVMARNDNVTAKNENRKHPDQNISAAVASMAFAGFDARRISNVLRISLETLYQYYRDEFENGGSRMIDRISGSLAQRALAGSDTAAIFLLKTRGGGAFSERQTVDVNVEVTHRTELVSQLASMLARGRVIDAEPEPEQKKGAELPAP